MNIFPRFKRQIFSSLLSSYTLFMFSCNLFVPVYADKINIESPQTVNDGDSVSIADSIYDTLAVSNDSPSALLNGGTITRVSNSEFLNNLYTPSSGSTSGAGINNAGLIDLIDESIFSNNNDGISNYFDITLIDNSIFTENNTGIYLDGLNADVSSVSNSTFTNNGAGILLKETGKEGNRAHLGTISNSTFENNSTGVQSSGSDIDSIKGSYFISNDTGVIANVSYSGGYIGLIDDTEFISNDRGVSVSGGRVDTISNSTFGNNNTGVAVSGSNTNGSSYLSGSIGTIENTLFQNNGYAITNYNNIELITDSTFSDNKYAGINNGGGYIDTIQNSVFSNNDRGIYTYNSSGNIETITGNTFTDNRVGIQNNNNIGSITDNKFNNNSTGISNSGNIDKISNAEFLNNGMSISNRNHGMIDNIAGIFIDNGTNGGKYNDVSSGSAINNKVFVDYYGEIFGADIGIITGVFENNKIENVKENFENSQNISSFDVSGGAIYNSGKIQLITDSDFKNNSVTTDGAQKNAYGGAIYNGQEIYYGSDGINMHIDADILNIKKQDGTIETVAFVYDSSTGAAIDYNKYKELVSLGVDVTTHTETVSEKEILEELGIDNINILIEDMVANGATKEDVLKYYTEHMPDENVPEGHLTISNSSFIDNHAESKNGEAKGGAIYSNRNLKISANNGYHSLISGNYTISNGIKDENAIHMAQMEYVVDSIYDRDTKTTTTTYKKVVPSLILDANTDGIIQIDDKISGEKGEKEWQITETYIYDDEGHYVETTTEEKVLSENKDQGYKICISGDNTGTVILNNDVEGEADMYLYQTTLKLGKRDDVLKNNNMTFNSGK